MKPGEPLHCLHRLGNNFHKKESLMNGWKKIGEILHRIFAIPLIW
jgi:hypothetical protein